MLDQRADHWRRCCLTIHPCMTQWACSEDLWKQQSRSITTRSSDSVYGTFGFRCSSTRYGVEAVCDRSASQVDFLPYQVGQL